MLRYLLCCLMLWLPCAATAQQFLDHLRTQQTGEGTVTVTQNKNLDSLVDNADLCHVAVKNNSADKTDNKNGDQTADKQPKNDSKKINRLEGEVTNDETPMVDTHKKVMRQSYKVNGYRVQVYAGGSSREAKRRAEQIGNDIKRHFPTEPVYVHFYSPRWICRMGNYRTQAEADDILQQVRNMGYKEAILVRGKISAQY